MNRLFAQYVILLDIEFEKFKDYYLNCKGLHGIKNIESSPPMC